VRIISYRRDDTAYPAGWLSDRLAGHFGRQQVFKDVDSIPLGDDAARVIAAAVASCDALVVLIGRHWLTAACRPAVHSREAAAAAPPPDARCRAGRVCGRRRWDRGVPRHSRQPTHAASETDAASRFHSQTRLLG
jgi:TIR domain